MAKIVLNDLTSNYGSQTLHNTNNGEIESHLNSKVLYRDNPSGEPNQMENDLDMNSNDILNGASASFTQITLNGEILDPDNTGVTTLPDQTGNATNYLRTDGSAAYWDAPIIRNVMDFGAVGDGVTDDYPAFLAAYNDLPDKGGKIYIPATTSNRWRFSQHLDIRKMVHIEGQIAQGGSSTTAGTQIWVDEDQAGFIFNSLGTSDYGLADGYAYTINPYSITTMPSDGLEGAYGSILENVSVQASVKGTANVDGIVIRCQMECRKVHARNFPRHGFRIHAGINNANADEHGDANQWVLKNCKAILNGGDGLHTDGLDANAGVCDKFFSQLNTGYGVYDNSFLSNTYISFDTAGNGIAPFYSDRNTNECTLIGCHDDGAGGSTLGSTVTSVGGNGLQPSAASQGFHMSAGVARNAPFKYLNEDGSEDIGSTLGRNDSTLTAFTFGAQSESASTDAWKFKFEPTDKEWYWQFANSTSFEPVHMLNSAAPLYTNSGLTGPVFQNGYGIVSSGSVTNAIVTLLGTAAPVSGTHTRGSRVLNTAPSVDGNNMVLDHWVCTVAGTPGTWVAQYLSTVSPAT